MKITEINYPFENRKPQQIVLVLGFFDGVHKGHQQLLKAGRKKADELGLPLIVMTFDQHPRIIYAHDQDFRYLTTILEKADVMSEFGVDELLVFNFNKQLEHLGPEEFVDSVLCKLNAKVVVAGFDYTYGKKDIANMENLPKFAAGRFDVIQIPEQKVNGKKIGSTAIRDALESGEIELANQLLGHPYLMSGKVVPGKQRGRKLGFRTANLAFNPDKIVPKIGVYATKLKVHDQWYEAMTSVGYNVMFEDQKQIFIETNIFDFDEDIYGEEITLAWYKYLRGEENFANVDELINQLNDDKKETLKFFK